MNTPIIDLEELLDEAKDRIEEKLIIEGELKNEYELVFFFAFFMFHIGKVC